MRKYEKKKSIYIYILLRTVSVPTDRFLLLLGNGEVKKTECQQKRQKTIILLRRILRHLREAISTRVDTSATFNLECDSELARGL